MEATMEKQMVTALIVTGKIKTTATYHVRKPNTFCHLEVLAVNGPMVGVGFAKWNPNDRDEHPWDYDEARGKSIAFLRAADELADVMLANNYTLELAWGKIAR